MPDAQTSTVPVPQHAEGAKNTPPKEQYKLSTKKGSALHEEESEEEAFHRIMKQIWHVGDPARTPYLKEIRENRDAYDGVVKASSTDRSMQIIFPIVHALTDAKLSVILAGKPHAVFEHALERQKLPLIEDAYNTFTSDVDHGIDLDSVDYTWHWYNELDGFAVKRIWHEVDTKVCYDPTVVRDEMDNIVYNDDGYAKIEYKRRLYKKGRTKQRVYEPEMVIVDPSATTLNDARWIAFVEDMHYDEWEQQYKFNPLYKNTEFVKPGSPMGYSKMGGQLGEGTDVNGAPALVYYDAAHTLETSQVRIVEWYNIDRDEYAVYFNNVPSLHVPNPCPPDPDTGEKKLPAADLHDHPRPGSFYSRGEGKLNEAYISIYQKLMNAKSKRAQLAAAPIIVSSPASGLTPKSFKVVPGAHWRGMKGNVETLNLAGVDTGEVAEYLQIIRSDMKVASGVDFDRFIADPDPTALQQAARDAATQVRTDKDIKRYEAAHVRAMDITLQNIIFWMTIPEIADMAEATPEELEEITEADKLPPTEDGKQFYRKYAKMRTKGKRYIESYDEEKGFGLQLDRSVKNRDGYLPMRPEYVRTKGKVRVRAVSNRKNISNRQLRYEQAKEMVGMAFELPPKNETEIAAAMTAGSPPPKPKTYVNRQKAVERMIDATGEDVKEMTAEEGDGANMGPAQKLISEFMQTKNTLLPDDKNPQAPGMSPTMAPPTYFPRERTPKLNATPQNMAA